MAHSETAPPAPAGIEAEILDFLAYLELERGLSRNTLEAYRSDLLQFGEFLDRRALSLADTQHGDIAGFLSELAAGGAERPPVAAATLARKVAALRCFYRHLRREGVLEHDPTADLRGPPKTRTLPRVLSREEVARLLSEPRGAGPRAVRDRALLEVMYACGLRASEAIGLELADVDLEEGVLCARGKGSKERLVPIGTQAVAALRAYYRSGRPGAARGGLRVAPVRQQPRHPPHASGPLQDRSRSCAQGRPGGEDEPAHAASHLRHAPARRRLRPALVAGDARARRPRDNAGLHASVGRSAQGRLFQRAPTSVALSGRDGRSCS